MVAAGAPKAKAKAKASAAAPDSGRAQAKASQYIERRATEIISPIVPDWAGAVISGFTFGAKLMELAIDSAGDEALLVEWYREHDSLPILRQLTLVSALFGILGWFLCIRYQLPAAFGTDAVGEWIGCVPALGIPLMVFFSAKTEALVEPGAAPAPAARDEVLAFRRNLAVTAFVILVAPIVTYKCKCMLYRLALRKKQHDKVNRYAVPNVKGIPRNVEVLPYKAFHIMEMALQAFILTLILVDLSVHLTGNEALRERYFARRETLPYVQRGDSLIKCFVVLKLMSVFNRVMPGKRGPGAMSFLDRRGPQLVVCALLHKYCCLYTKADKSLRRVCGEIFVIFVSIVYAFFEDYWDNRGVVSWVIIEPRLEEWWERELRLSEETSEKDEQAEVAASAGAKPAAAAQGKGEANATDKKTD